MSDELLFLDVNVPMYAAGAEHPWRSPCVWVLTEVAAGRLNVAIDAEIVQEVLYRLGARREWEKGAVLAQRLMDLVQTIYPVTAADMATAIALFRRYGPQGVKARDCLHVAVMQAHHIHRIISVDRDFEHVPDVVRIDPMVLYQQRMA